MIIYFEGEYGITHQRINPLLNLTTELICASEAQLNERQMPDLAMLHLQSVRWRCQLFRGKVSVPLERRVRCIYINTGTGIKVNTTLISGKGSPSFAAITKDESRETSAAKNINNTKLTIYMRQIFGIEIENYDTSA
jgi:hypothetical protein